MWAVIKRLERFGAPELVNLAPLKPVEALPGAWTVEDDRNIVEAPRSRLSNAIIAGEISAAAAAEGTDPPDLNTDPDVAPPAEDDDDDDLAALAEEHEAEVAAQRAAEAGAGDLVPPGETTLDNMWQPVAELSAEDLAEATATAQQRLYDAAIRIQRAGTMSPSEYGAVIRRLGEKYNPDNGGKLSTSALTLEQAREALDELLTAAGEAPPPEATS
jgi:hypothetical protein